MALSNLSTQAFLIIVDKKILRDLMTLRVVQTLGVSGPHWKKSCLGPHMKYTVTCNHTHKNLIMF